MARPISLEYRWGRSSIMDATTDDRRGHTVPVSTSPWDAVFKVSDRSCNKIRTVHRDETYNNIVEPLRMHVGVWTLRLR